MACKPGDAFCCVLVGNLGSSKLDGFISRNVRVISVIPSCLKAHTNIFLTSTIFNCSASISLSPDISAKSNNYSFS